MYHEMFNRTVANKSKKGRSLRICIKLVLLYSQTVKAFLPSMLKKNKGHIVSTASSAGLFGVGGLSDYCASKFGAVGFMEALRWGTDRYTIP